jgi:uncharacterized membrane protein
MELNKQTYLILVTAALIWCLLILLPPVLMKAGATGKSISVIDYKFFGHICHQFDERSLHIRENKLTVCARCSGIYFGFLIGVLIIPFFKNIKIRNIKYGLCLIMLPMLIDVALDFVGIHNSNTLTRALTGLMFGIPSAVLIYPSFEQGINQILNRKERIKYYVRKT